MDLKDKLDQIFQFVVKTCAEFSIDESHGLKHSIDVVRYSEQIYQVELVFNPELKSKHQVILFSAALHDMCDHKYLDQKVGLERITKLLGMDLKLDTQTINLICKIISTMSYSKIKTDGFAQFDDLIDQLTYNIVREADLLTAYDFDRSVVYSMANKKNTWSQAVQDTAEYFKIRVLKQISDGLFFTTHGLVLAHRLHSQALSQINLCTDPFF